MGKTIVTTVGNFIDIDGYASDLAYAELLNLSGLDAVAVPFGPLNSSITNSVKKFGGIFVSDFSGIEGNFVVMDMSDPEFLKKYLDISKITEIYDHRFGFKDYWKEKLGDKCHIEPVGSCATLVFEKFMENGKLNKISKSSANLLATSIISNTLYFKSSLTAVRDTNAYAELLKLSKLPANWPELYYGELEESVYSSPEYAVKTDTKFLKLDNLPFELAIGQIELWNSHSFIEKYKNEIVKGLESYKYDHWFLTSPSISEGKNYIYTNNQEVKDLLQKTLDVIFSNDVAQTDKLIMRKEILKKLRDVKLSQ